MSNFNENTKEIKNKASSLYDAAKENVVEAYNKTKPQVDELTSKIGQTASDLYEEGKKTILQTEHGVEDTIKDTVRKQPLVSVLVAAGIGYLCAKLLK